MGRDVRALAPTANPRSSESGSRELRWSLLCIGQDGPGDLVLLDVGMPREVPKGGLVPPDGERPRRRKRKLRPWEMAELPVVSEERVLQLARDEPRSREYRRESPPLRAEDRAALERLPFIEEPAAPGVFLLWQGDRIICCGSSIAGLFGHGVAAHHYGSRSRFGVAPKQFDKVTFIRVPEGLLDFVTAAITRLLHPKWNRRGRRSALADETEQTERDRELLARFGLEIVGWRGLPRS